MDSLRNQIVERKVIELITSHALVVELPDTGDAFVMADAVRIERINLE